MNKKKRTTIMLVLSLVALISVGATMAYLSAKTTEVSNGFSLMTPEGFSAKIVEPSFIGDEVTKAKSFIKGQVVKKDPCIENTSTDNHKAWVAMRVKIKVNGADATAAQITLLNKVLEVNFQPEWTREGSGTGFELNGTVFYYNDLLTNSGSTKTTKPLFKEVTYKATASDADISAVGAWNQFDIVVQGVAVDESVGNLTAAKPELLALATALP